MSHFKPHLTLEESRMLTENYVDIDYSRLCDLLDRKPRRFKIRAVYLHASKTIKPMKSLYPGKKGSQGSYKDTPPCDRFVVLGVEGTQHVLLYFIPTPQSTKQALRFSQYMTPGQSVLVMNPEIKSFVGDNAVVDLRDPLIPIPNCAYYQGPQFAPPANLIKAHYVWFSFVTNALELSSASPVDSICSGTFCDAQSEKATCACTASDPKKHWCVNFVVTCPEFEEMARSNVHLTSNKTTGFFVDNRICVLPLSDRAIDTIAMEDSVSFDLKRITILFRKNIA